MVYWVVFWDLLPQLILWPMWHLDDLAWWFLPQWRETISGGSDIYRDAIGHDRFWIKWSLRVRHVWYILLVECQTAPCRQLFPQMVVVKDCPGIPFWSAKTSRDAGVFRLQSLELIYPAVQIPQQYFCSISPVSFLQPILILIVLAVCPIDPAVMLEDWNILGFFVLSIPFGSLLCELWPTHESILLIDPHDFKYQQTTRVKR